MTTTTTTTIILIITKATIHLPSVITKLPNKLNTNLSTENLLQQNVCFGKVSKILQEKFKKVLNENDVLIQDKFFYNLALDFNEININIISLLTFYDVKKLQIWTPFSIVLRAIQGDQPKNFMLIYILVKLLMLEDDENDDDDDDDAAATDNNLNDYYECLWLKDSKLHNIALTYSNTQHEHL